MKPFCAVIIAAFISVRATAQPVELQKGDSVTVVMGSGTEMESGTKLRGTVTRYNEEGLGFRVVNHGSYWIKWSHIRSINGVRLTANPTDAATMTDTAPDASSTFNLPARSLPEPRQPEQVPSERVDWESHEHRNMEATPVSSDYSRETRRSDDAPERSYKIVASLDYFGVGNASKGLSSTTRDVCVALIAGGATSCRASASVNGAAGFRGGFWKSAEGFDWGASLGYLYGGPSGSAKLTADIVPVGSAMANQSDNTVRLMGEVRKSIPLNDLWSLRMGAGLGMAVDFWKASCSNSGSLVGVCTDVGLPSPESGSQSWITWELSPSIAYGRWSAGLRYAGFGRTGATPWNTFGGFLGAEF